MYEDIQAQFNNVITYSQNIPDPKTTSLFHRWEASKSKFIHLFGDKLIFEYPEEVTFELSEREKESRINEFIDYVVSHYNSTELADFIAQNKKGFFLNQVQESPNKKIPRGMKLVKAFKFFGLSQERLEKLQAEASAIIQEDKIKGRLCLSVHPLDFLSISETCHNWRSCHALDGEYRAGNLSYMVDTSTVICYLKSDKEDILPNFPAEVPWNSKKWRVLLFFSESGVNEMLFAGRQYPFSSENGLNFIRQELLPKAGLGKWGDWSDDKIKEYNGRKLFTPYVQIYNGLYAMKDLVGNQHGSLNYNDLLFSTVYDPVYSFNTKFHFLAENKPPKFRIGGQCNCLRCGEDQIEITDSMMCNTCELYYGDSDNDMFAFCPCCGQRFYYDDGYWIEGDNGDEMICQDCGDEYTDYCSRCGIRYYKDDLYYDENEDIWICKYCKDENREEY